MQNSKNPARFYQGVVKWFNKTKGLGFIKGNIGSQDVFVHYSVIEQKGFRMLKNGEKVFYKKRNALLGPLATYVKKILE